MAQQPRNKANKPDTTQPFKAAVGATVRAVAARHDLEVAFTSDRPILTTDKARLANLPRLPTARDIAIARGQGDAMAMRMASHDAEMHRRRCPADPEARAAFDALEQARVEALAASACPACAETCPKCSKTGCSAPTMARSPSATMPRSPRRWA